MRISDWSSDVCSSDLAVNPAILVPVFLDLDVQEQVDLAPHQFGEFGAGAGADFLDPAAALAEHDRTLVVARDEDLLVDFGAAVGARLEQLGLDGRLIRSEEHTSELQ